MMTDKLNREIRTGNAIAIANGHHKLTVGIVVDIFDNHFNYIDHIGRIHSKYVGHGLIILDRPLIEGHYHLSDKLLAAYNNYLEEE